MQYHALLLLIFSITLSAQANDSQFTLKPDVNTAIGVGFAAVKFDTKFKFTDKASGSSIFIDPEGNLGLPETSRVNTFYGGHRFNQRHSIGFGYFAINRESELFSLDKNFDDVILVNGHASLTDRTSFYHLAYGYGLFDDERSRVTFKVGLKVLDLKYVFEAEGQLIVDGVSENTTVREEADVFAPLPLIGLDFDYKFTPRWGMATKVAMVVGSYQDVSASVLQTSVNFRYGFTKHVGAVLGITYFDADIDIEDEADQVDITYCYDGAFLGMHFVF